MSSSPAETVMVELLSELLAQRTGSGEAHVIRSAVDVDILTHHDRHDDPGTFDRDLLQLRNYLVHQQVDIASVDVSLRRWRVVFEAAATDRAAAIVRVREVTSATRPEVDGPTLETFRILVNGFLERLLDDPALLAKLEGPEARRLGETAAADILAAARWSQVVGDRIDTATATRVLGVSRQALAKRQSAGSLLGIPGKGTTWYPTWQFDPASGDIRPEVRDVIGAFREKLDDVDPLLVAAWATTLQDEDLDGRSPEEWIRLGLNRQRLRIAAERAAARLA